MESTLSLKYDDLRAAVGFFLGYGSDPAAWEDDVHADEADRAERQEKRYIVGEIVKSGLRQFYYPPPLQGQLYDWAFLQPTVALTFAADQWEYDLPDDFGGAIGDLAYSGSSNTPGFTLPITGEGSIHQKRSLAASTSGRPCLAAIRPKRGTTPAQGQRFELIVWPTPEQAYTVQLTYYLLPEALGQSRPYPYGGMAHAETIKASCLAMAELHIDNREGEMAREFAKRLAASMALDRRQKPQRIGHNLDRSDGWRDGFNRRDRSTIVTVYGQEY